MHHILFIPKNGAFTPFKNSQVVGLKEVCTAACSSCPKALGSSYFLRHNNNVSKNSEFSLLFVALWRQSESIKKFVWNVMRKFTGRVLKRALSWDFIFVEKVKSFGREYTEKNVYDSLSSQTFSSSHFAKRKTFRVIITFGDYRSGESYSVLCLVLVETHPSIYE